MSIPRQLFTGSPDGRVRWQPLGFAPPEIALALLVIALTAVLILTLAGWMRQRRGCDQYIRDLGDFSAVFQGYHRQHDSWPPSGSADVALPPALRRALQATNWFKGSPFGGKYAWVAPDPASAAGHGPGRWGGRGAITLGAFSPDPPLAMDQAALLYIDRQLDDGNLETGRFRTGFNGWPVFLVEAARQ